MKKSIRKAVVPVAGLGTRLLPATKSIPKEMLPVVDRPVIQIVMDEAREAGIEHFVFVTGRNKTVIEDYFDKNQELELALGKGRKAGDLEALRRNLPLCGEVTFTRQQEPLGLGHAVWCARHLIGDEPFAVLLPDMIMQSSPGCTREMIRLYERQGGGNVVALQEVDWSSVSRYGVAGVRQTDDGILVVNKLVEKPSRASAPSNYIISGRYILQPRIFELLANLQPGSGGEIQLTDAMAELMNEQSFWGLMFGGTTHDCGDKLGYLLANVAFGLQHQGIGDDFRTALIAMLANDGVSQRSEQPTRNSVRKSAPKNLLAEQA